MLQILTYMLVFAFVAMLIVDSLWILYRNIYYFIDDDNSFGDDCEYKLFTYVSNQISEIATTIISFFSVIFGIVYILNWLIPRQSNDKTDLLVDILNGLFTIPTISFIIGVFVIKHIRTVIRLKKQKKLNTINLKKDSRSTHD